MKKVLDRLRKRGLETAIITVFLAMILGGIAASDVLDAGSNSDLVAEYRFDEGAGDIIYDYSSNSHDGSFQPNKSFGPDWTEGKVSGALNFDGNDDYVEADSLTSDLAGSDFTASAWFRTSGSADTIFAFNQNDGSNRILVYSDAIYDNVDGQNRNYGVNTLDGQWHHLVVSHDESADTNIVYIDGKRVTSTPSADTVASDDQFSIGQEWDGGSPSSFFNGKIDDLRVYSEAFNLSQAKSLYNQGSFRPGSERNGTSGKVLDIGFRKQNSSHVFDTSGENNHGEAINGTEQLNAVDCKVGRCLKFDRGGYVNVSNSSTLDKDQFTAMAWVYLDEGVDLSQSYEVVSRGDTLMKLRYDNRNGGWRTEIRGEDSSWYKAITTSKPPTGEWIHLASTFDSTGELKLYVDGRLLNTTMTGTVPDEDFQGSEVFKIGKHAAQNTNWMNGHIDQVKVFDSAISQKEIIEEAEKLESSGAVLDLRLNEGGGDIARDSSLHGNDGNLNPDESTGPKWVEGVNGNALEFDGKSGRVDVSNDESLNITDTLTISAWVKNRDFSNTSVNGGIQVIVDAEPGGRGGIQDGYMFGVSFEDDGDSGIGFHYGNGTHEDDDNALTASDILVRNKWHHAAVTVNGSDIRLYVDGELRKTVSQKATDITPNQAPQIGSHDCSTCRSYFNGTIDSVKIYPYSVSSSKVKQLYRQGSSRIGQKTSEASIPHNPSRDSLLLYQSFDRVEVCGQSDTLSCPEGLSGGGSSSTFSVSSQSDWNNGVFNGTFISQNNLALGFLGNESVSTSQTQDFVIFHRLNETSGSTAFDYSGNGYDGNINGPTLGADSLFSESAYSFDGTDDNVTVPYQSEFDQTEFTINFWFKTTGVNDDIAVLTNKQVSFDNRNWWIAMDNGQGFAGGNGYLGFRTSSGGSVVSLEAQTDYRDGNWHMVTGVIDAQNDEAEFWVDGDLKDNQTGVGDPDLQNQPVVIGDEIGSDRQWKGEIANHMIIDEPLNGSQIKQLYLHGMDGTFQANYTSQKIDNSNVQQWSDIQVDAAIPGDTDVDAVFRALDSGGSVQEKQVINLSDGDNNYNLNVQDTEDAEVFFNGTSTNESESWEISSFNVSYSGTGSSGEIAVDGSGEANHGELVDSPLEEGAGGCRSGRCLEFDHNDPDYINISTPPLDGEDAMTISTWVKSEVNDTDAAITGTVFGGSADGGTGIRYDDDGFSGGGDAVIKYSLNTDSGGTNAETENVTQTTEWQHLALRWSTGSEPDMFVDGSEVGYTDPPSSLGGSLTMSKRFIGRGLKDTAGTWNGKIDEFRIYNKSLSNEEIWSLYSRGRDRLGSNQMPGPIGWWRFNEFSGQDVYDSVEDLDGVLGSSGSSESSDPSRVNTSRGPAIQADGFDDEVEISHSDRLETGSFTFATWFKLREDPDCDGNGNWRGFAKKGNTAGTDTGFDVVLEGRSEFTYDIGNGTNWENRLSSNQGVSVGEWAHLTFVYDNNTKDQEIYFNGELDAARTVNGFKKQNTDPLELADGANTGSCPSSNGHTNGTYDGVRYYPYALSQEQIQQVMRDGAASIG